MPLFGPRLDRPSAIGDDGRPRATSLTIASITVVALFGLTSFLTGVFDFALATATLTGLATMGLALLNRERFLSLFLGQVCYVLGGTGLVGLVGALFVVSPSYGLLLAGFALAFVGIASTWADVGDRESANTAISQGGISYVTMFLWFLTILSVVGVGLWFWSFLTERAASAPPAQSLFVFFLAVCLSSVCAWVALRWLPVRQLTPRVRRPRIERRLRLLRLSTVAVGLSSFAVAVVVWYFGRFTARYVADTLAARAFDLLSTPSILGIVLAIGLLVFVAGLVARVLRRATRPVDERANRLLAGLLAGLAFTVGLLPFLFSLVPLPGSLAFLASLTLVVFGPLAFLFVGIVFLVAVELEILPDRAGGPALSAFGLLLATIGGALVGAPAPVVFACAAGTMVVWDVSTFGLGVTAELGHLPETRRLELFHGLLGVSLGVVLVVALAGLDVLRTTVASELVVVPAVVLAVTGVLFLLVPVRG